MAKVTDRNSADRLLLEEIRRREGALSKGHRPTGKDEAVVARASERDRLKYIPRRLN